MPDMLNTLVLYCHQVHSNKLGIFISPLMSRAIQSTIIKPIDLKNLHDEDLGSDTQLDGPCLQTHVVLLDHQCHTWCIFNLSLT
jgi:hypothetical protein